MTAGAATTQPMVMPRAGGAAGLKPARPGVAQSVRSTQRIVLPPSAPNPNARVGVTKPLTMAPPTGRINLPMGMILRCLPPEVLAADLSEFESSGAAATEIGLPMNMILSQLPSGKVEMALQDLIPHFPAGYVQPTESIAAYLPTLINLPLMDVVMRIPPDLLALRPDQKDVDAAVINMADPFTEEILREQAEAARQQNQPNIIEENQVPQAEEFVPQAAAPRVSAPTPAPLQRPPSGRLPTPPAARQPTGSLPQPPPQSVQRPPSMPLPTAAAPMPSAPALPTPGSVRASSPTPPTPPSATARTISPSGRLPAPSRATTPIPTRPPSSPVTVPTTSAQPTIPIPPSQRPTAGVPLPAAIPPQPPILTPAARQATGALPQPRPGSPTPSARLPMAPPPPTSHRAPTGPVQQPPLPPPVVGVRTITPVQPPPPEPEPAPASAATPPPAGDDLARLAALAMQQMGETEEAEPASSLMAEAKTIPLTPVSAPVPTPPPAVEPEPVQEEAPVAVEPEPEPEPVPAPEPEPQPEPEPEPEPESFLQPPPMPVIPPAPVVQPPPPVVRTPVIPAPAIPRTIPPERPKLAPTFAPPPVAAQPPPPPQPVAPPPAVTPTEAEAAPAPSAPVAININSCSADDLALIPGCSAVLAGAIIRHRTKLGSFKKLEDLLDVPGMTATTYTNLTGEAPPSVEVPYTLNELLGFPAGQNVTLKDVTDRICCWPDVSGCMLSQSSGLPLVGSVPSGLDKTAIVAFVPRIFEAINKSFAEITGRETDELILPTAGTSFTILRNKDLYLIILSRLPLMPERHLKVARFVLGALSARQT